MRLNWSSLRTSPFWAGCAGALVALIVALGLWHSVQDHRALHRMIGLWNQYGPTLQQRAAPGK